MTDLTRAIESILINSNDARVDEEISKGRSSSYEDLNVRPQSSVSSFDRAHIPEGEHVPEHVPERKNDELGNADLGDMEETDNYNLLLGRVESLVFDKKIKEEIDRFINKLLSNKILASSMAISKVDIDVGVIDSKTISVLFDENAISATHIDNKNVDGSEIVYVDCEGRKVDFLILRNINNNEFSDVTAQYRIKVNNELVSVS